MNTGGREPAGWLILSRKLFPSDLWLGAREPFCKRAALVDLLQLAAHSGHVQRIQGRELHVKPGELVTSARWLADRWGWSKTKATRFLLELRKRGTLSMAPAWNKQTSTTVPPTVYSFPRYLEHQRRTVGQERGPGDTPVTKGDTPYSVPRDAGQGSGGWAREAGQERGPGNTPASVDGSGGSVSRECAQESGPGRRKSGPGKPRAITDVLRGSVSRDKKKVVKKEPDKTVHSKLYDSLFPELEELSPKPQTFHLVGALADIADRYGQHPRHRGLNVRILLERLEGGAKPATLAHAIRGLRAMVEAGELSGFIAPGEPFQLSALFGESQVQGSRPVFSAAAELSPSLDAVAHDV